MKSKKEQHSLVKQRFFQVIKLLLIQNQIFGITVHSYDGTQFQVSMILMGYRIISVVVYSALATYCIVRIANLTNGPTTIYKTTDILILIVNASYLGTMWTCAALKRKEVANFLYKIVFFDEEVYKCSGIELNYERNRKLIIRGLLIRYSILVVLISYLLSHTLIFAEVHSVVADNMSYFLMVVNSAFCQFTTEVVLILKHRFTILNKQIRKLILSHRNVITIEKPSDGLSLNMICSLHHHLTKLIKVFNENFGLTLLFMFGVSFVMIVVSLFYCAAELQRTKIVWLRFLWSLLLCLSFILDTVYVCYVCYVTIEEAKKAGALIHKIEDEDSYVKDQIEMFSLQIANEEIEFNAAGFFPVNFTLLFSVNIIGGVTTYIIILIQLAATLSDQDD